MTLSKEDWQDILGHTRARVREAGLAEIDMQVTMDFRTTESSGADFLRYLTSLISALGERSYSGYQRTLDTFRECLRSENGKPIEGVEIRIEDRDYGVYGTSLVSLADQTDLSIVIGELKNLRKELLEAGLFDEEVSG